jgi:hypothetical protein
MAENELDMLKQALRTELMYLWDDLSKAYADSRATPPERSMGCENVINRIHAITKLVGPLPAREISMPFLLTGMYEKVHAQIGIEATVPEETLRASREYVAEQEAHLGRTP